VQLNALSYLSLNGNAITEISPIFRYLPALKFLLLHQNRLKDVKELCYKEFAKLETLDLGTNKITEIPIAFVHFMRNLNALTLINNDLEKLPPLLGNHKKIRSLTLEGNPLKTIRRTVILKGTDAIMGSL